MIINENMMMHRQCCGQRRTDNQLYTVELKYKKSDNPLVVTDLQQGDFSISELSVQTCMQMPI